MASGEHRFAWDDKSNSGVIGSVGTGMGIDLHGDPEFSKGFGKPGCGVGVPVPGFVPAVVTGGGYLPVDE